MSGPGDLRVVDPGAADAPAPADREAWIAAGLALAQGRSEASWEFADWLAAGHAAWGREAMREAAEATGATAGKISHYLKTATGYPPLRRRNGLTFSHHMEVARLPEADADRVLDRAEAERWSRNETRAAAREVSLEVKNANLHRKVAKLERALAAAQADPGDAVKQTRSRLDAERRVIRDAVGRSAGMVEELAETGILDDLHGNARKGFADHVDRFGKRLAADVNAALDRMQAAADKVRASQ